MGDALAFLPNRLPPEIPIDRELLLATGRARAVVGELTGQARLIRNINLIIRPLARREAVLSSRIEGTQTEIRDLLLQEAEPVLPAEETDIHEVLNYLATVDLAQQWFAEGRSLDKSLVKELHARLLRGVRGEERSPGALRTREVYIGNRAHGFRDARFVPPPHEHVDALLDDLFRFTRGAPVYGPLIDCAIAHYQFEAIHPFEDGNGRVGRLLIPLQLMDREALDRPLVYLGPYLLSHDAEYRDRLLAVSTSGDWSGWILFMLEATRASAEDARARVDRVLTLRDEYQERVLAASNSKVPAIALDAVLDRVFVSVRDVKDATRTTYPTARAAIEALVSAGILVPHGRVRGRQLWRAEQLLREVYES
jgi:Fic family protein